jgi:hypothetical protein
VRWFFGDASGCGFDGLRTFVFGVPRRGTAYQPRATPWDQKPRTFWRSEGTLQTRGSTDRPRRYAAFLQNAPDSGCLSPGFHPGLVCIAPLGQGGYPRVDRPCSVRISGWDLGLICYPIGAGGYIRRSIGRVPLGS